MFENHKNELEKYSAIFIDEAQDYRYEWFVILKSFFLEENGEFVIFCDEKQNIYGRDLDSEKKVKTNIPGKWNKIETLDASYRSNENLVIIADKFQKEFLRNKYEYEKIKSKNQRLPFEKRITNYYYIDDKYEHKNDLIANLVINEYNNLSVNSDDVCVLSSFKEDLRYIEYKFRTSFKEDTHTTFLEFELYNELKEIYSKDWKCEEWWKKFCDEVERIENAYKFNFKLHSWQIKFSTIHSFKGLESYAVILIINSKDSEELIYTGITRARESLIVINNGNKKYDDFFRKNMQFQHLASIVA
ncbi:MAG: ATP-binding domain-containing protein [Defluviitoga tunisiensis]